MFVEMFEMEIVEKKGTSCRRLWFVAQIEYSRPWKVLPSKSACIFCSSFRNLRLGGGKLVKIVDWSTNSSTRLGTSSLARCGANVLILWFRTTHHHDIIILWFRQTHLHDIIILWFRMAHHDINLITPKRRFWKEEQKMQSGFRMKHFSRSWVLDLGSKLGYEQLKRCMVNKKLRNFAPTT
jgi:hypothetical protein